MSWEGGLLRVEISGQRAALQAEMAQDGQECWNAIFAECRATGASHVLVVARLTGWVSTAAVYSTFMHVARVIPPSIVKIAYVDLNAETKPYNDFAQELAQSRSMNIGVFGDEEEASQWLAAP